MPPEKLSALGPVATSAPIVNATFKRLDNLFKTFSLEKIDPKTAAGDKEFSRTADVLCTFTKANQVSLALQGFDSILKLYINNETIAYLILRLMSQYSDKVGNRYRGTCFLDNSLLKSLTKNLIKCRTCYESRIVISIFLDLNLDNASTDMNAALHRNNETACDHYIDKIGRFVSSLDEQRYFELWVQEFKKIIATAPADKDIIHYLAGSKMRYGYFEVFNLLSTYGRTIQCKLLTVSEILTTFPESPIFLQVFSYFACPPIMGWITRYPEDFLEYSKTGSSVELFNNLFTLYNRQLSMHANPTANVLNFRSLVTLIIMNCKVFEQFEFYHRRKEHPPETAHDSATFTSTEIKMFSVLMRLITPDKNVSVDEKHLILKCYMFILHAATAVSSREPNHPMVLFCKKYFSRIYEKIKDIIGSISSSVIENPLIEYLKIDFLAYSFLLMPEKVHSIYMYYIDNYYNLELYSYYIVMDAIRKISYIPKGTEYMIKYFLNLEVLGKIVERGFSISEIMGQTRNEYELVLNHTAVLKADLTDISLLEEHALITDKLSSNSSSTQSYNGLSAFQSNGKKDSTIASTAEKSNFQIDYSSILGNAGYLSRKVYDIAFDYCSISVSDFLPLDDLFVFDKALMADPQYFEEMCDKLFNRGQIAEPIFFNGLFDCQYSCFEAACRFLMRALSNKELLLHNIYYMFCTNVNLISKYHLNLITRSSYENSKSINHITFILKYGPTIASRVIDKVDIKRLFPNSSCSRYHQLVEGIKSFERFLYVFLCGAAAETYNPVRDTTRFYIDLVGRLPPDVSEALKQEINWNLITAIAKDSDVIIKSQRFVQKKVIDFFSNNIDKMSGGVLGAIDSTFQKVEDYFAINSLNKTEVVAFGNYSTFLSIVLGFGVPTNPSEAYSLIKGKLAHKFILGLVNTLESSNSKKRAVAEEILSSRLHSRLAFVVYVQCIEELTKLETKSKSTILNALESETICNYAKVLEKILRRLPPIMACQNSFRAVKVCHILVHILKSQYNLIYTKVHQVPRSSKPSVASSFVKTKLSVIKYVNAILKRLKDLAVNGTFILWRNQLLKTFLHWLEMAFFKEEVNFFSQVANSGALSKYDNHGAKIFHAYREVVLEIVTCLSTFSEGLLIIRENINYEKEVRIFRNIMFGNYYNVLVRILRKCLQDASNSEIPTLAYENNAQTSLTSEFNRLELEKVIHNTIMILGNLVKANYEIASSYVLPLITDTNSVIKDAFLQIFKHIFIDKTLNARAEENLNSEKTMQFAFTGLQNKEVILSMRECVSPNEMDRFASALLDIIDAGGFLQKTLRLLINYELESCLKPLDILRRNNLTTKLLSLVAKNNGGLFLRNTVGGVLNEIIEKKIAFELDQFYQGAENITNEDSGIFFYYFTKLVDCICESADNVPLAIKATCFNLRQLVDNFTENENVSRILIGTFFFLRFICPAIAYPEELNLVDHDPTDQAKRCFILLTKALQNASNGTLNIRRFPLLKGKEKEMEMLVNKISKFIDDISKEDLAEEADKPTNPPKTFAANSFKIVYTFTVNHAETLREYSTDIRAKTFHSMEWRQAYCRKVDLNFSTIGYKFLSYYPDVSEFIRTNKNKYIELFELINQSLNNPISEDIIESKFFTESVAKDGTQVFAITFSFFEGLDIDPKLLVARVLQSLSRASTTEYYIVIDCTLYNHKKQLPVLHSMMNLLYKLTPDELAEKCAGVFYVNVSSVFAPELLTILEENSLSEKKFLNPKFLRCSFLSTFEDQKIIESFNLPKWTYLVSSGGKELAEKIAHYDTTSRTAIPMRLRLTNCHVIYSLGDLKKIKLGRFSRAFKVVNFEPLVDWKELRETVNPHLDGTFEVYSSLLHKTLTLVSPKKNELISIYYLNMSNYQVNLYNQTRQFKMANKVVGSTDLSGEAVLIIGLGLLADEAGVRKQAYDLLHQFHKYLGYDDGTQFSEFASAFSPPKSQLAVSSFSSNLAKAFPELAKEVVTSFVYIANNGENVSDTIKDFYIILEPWIDHLHDKVYLNTHINGEELTRIFIASIVKFIPTEEANLVSLNEGIWSKIICVDKFMSYLLEEVTKEVLNRKFTGVSSDNLVNLMTLNPSLKVCSEIINQLLEATKFPKSFEGQEARINLYWAKITLLLQICVALIFDNIFFVEKFLPEILCIGSFYYRLGAFDVKSLIRKLLVNTINTLATNDIIGKESRKKLLLISRTLASDRFSPTFGLHSGNTSLHDSEESVQKFYNDYLTAKMLNEQFVAVLQIPEYGENNYRRVWFSKFLQLTIPLMSDHNSVFQRKGLIFGGFLASMGTQDMFVRGFLNSLLEYMEMMYNGDSRFSFGILLFHCAALARTVSGLQNDSVYYSVLCWLGVVLVLQDNALLFEIGLVLFFRTAIAMSERQFFEKDNIWNVLVRGVKERNELMLKFLSKPEYNLVFENDVFLIVGISKAIAVNMIKYTIMSSTVIEFASMKISCAKKQALKTKKFDLDAVAMMMPVFCFTESADELLEKSGFNLAEMKFQTLSNGDRVPEILIQFMSSTSKASKATLICCAKLFCYDVTTVKFRIRFLLLLRLLANRSSFLLEFTFPIISKALYAICNRKDVSLELLLLVNEIQAMTARLRTKLDYTADSLYKEFFKENNLAESHFEPVFSSDAHQGLSSKKVEEFKESPVTKMVYLGLKVKESKNEYLYE